MKTHALIWKHRLKSVNVYSDTEWKQRHWVKEIKNKALERDETDGWGKSEEWMEKWNCYIFVFIVAKLFKNRKQ